MREEFGFLREYLSRLSDHRFRRGLVHPLEVVLSWTVLGLMCGCSLLSAIYRFGDTQPQLLSRLGLGRSPEELAGYADLPGLSSAIMVKKRVIRRALPLVDSIQYAASNRSAWHRRKTWAWCGAIGLSKTVGSILGRPLR